MFSIISFSGRAGDADSVQSEVNALCPRDFLSVNINCHGTILGNEIWGGISGYGISDLMGVLEAVGRWPPPMLMMSYQMEREEGNERQIMIVAEVADKRGGSMG